MAYLLPETRLLHALLRLHGQRVDGFSAAFLSDGSIRVTGPGSAAFYPVPGWTSHFLRHLHCGYFQPVALAQRRLSA